MFRGDADGVHLVGGWPHEMRFWPHELGAFVEKGLVTMTIKVKTDEAWALYRIDQLSSTGMTLVGRRIRHGRGKARA